MKSHSTALANRCHPVSKILATSDLHGYFPWLEPCDVLIIAGNVCPVYDHSVRYQLGWLDTNFRNWLENIEADYILGIAGNHDFVFERWPDEVEKLNLPWTYLKDDWVPLYAGLPMELSVFGSPWVPNLARWAFHQTDEGLDARLALIPEHVDIVISHGPPFQFCDLTSPRFGNVHAGFPGANDMLEHIHEGYGKAIHPSGTMIYNVSHQTENYEPINDPMEIDVA